MLERAGIGCARPAAGRIAAVTAVLALLASLAGFSARPAAAGLVSGDSVPETTVLQTNVDVLPGDTADTGTFVLTVPIRLQAGQSRRISDQLTVTVPRAAVVQNIVECVDPLSGNPVTVAGRPEAHSSGTNYSPSMGQLSMHASFLFTAPVTGTFFCQIRAQTDAGNDLGFHMTVVAAPRPGGTWLEIDNFTDAAPLWWQINTCDSTGSDPNCVFLGRPGGREHPTTTILHGWPSTFLDTPFLHVSDLWVARPNATTADVVGHMQITSCYFGTASCPEREQGAPENGPFDAAVFRTHLDLLQLDQHFAVCKVNSTPDTQYTIKNAVHHFLVDYGPMTVPIAQTCGGSRVFALHIVVSWHGRQHGQDRCGLWFRVPFGDERERHRPFRRPDYYRARRDRGRPGLGSRPPRRVRTDDGHGDPRGEPGRGRARDRPEFSPGDHRAGRITRGPDHLPGCGDRPRSDG